MSYYDGWYPPSAPRPKPKPGKERKRFGATWWGKKWIDGVEKRGESGRMSRGRAYARADKVYGIKIQKGKVIAQVQGNSGRYKVHVGFPEFKSQEWDRIIATMRKSPALGTILSNELPENIDRIIGKPLIHPGQDIRCSCPDWERPCKHLAALYYVLSDEIDKAPQILFMLRGMGPQDLYRQLTMSDLPPGGAVLTGPAVPKATKPKATKGTKERKALRGTKGKGRIKDAAGRKPSPSLRVSRKGKR